MLTTPYLITGQLQKPMFKLWLKQICHRQVLFEKAEVFACLVALQDGAVH